MIQKYKKIILITVTIIIVIILNLESKIVVNNSFIENYPSADQSWKLLYLSFLNYYEPYIAPYNYGNYYYKKERYEDAYKKYKEALKYKIPNIRKCDVDINISLSLIKIAENKSDAEALKLYDEARGYLNDCLELEETLEDDDTDEKKDKDDEEKEEEEKDKDSDGSDGPGGNKPKESEQEEAEDILDQVTAKEKKLDDNALNDKIDALGGGEYTINDIFDVISRDDLNIPLPSAGAAPTYGSCNKCW